jgi:hypothetical protein
VFLFLLLLVLPPFVCQCLELLSPADDAGKTVVSGIPKQGMYQGATIYNAGPTLAFVWVAFFGYHLAGNLYRCRIEMTIIPINFVHYCLFRISVWNHGGPSKKKTVSTSERNESLRALSSMSMPKPMLGGSGTVSLRHATLYIMYTLSRGVSTRRCTCCK